MSDEKINSNLNHDEQNHLRFTINCSLVIVVIGFTAMFIFAALDHTLDCIVAFVITVIATICAAGGDCELHPDTSDDDGAGGPI